MAFTATHPLRTNDGQNDPRPRFAIGHVAITAENVTKLTEFYTTLGMRQIMNSGHFAILELRGGTHLIVQQGPAGAAVLDLIVDDIDDVHADLTAAGATAGDIKRGHPHDQFQAIDPEGNRLAISSNHAMGVV